MKVLQNIKLKLQEFILSEAFKKKPITLIFRLIILFLLTILRTNFKYKVRIRNSEFIYTCKYYKVSGLGGRGQFIFREFYEDFFKIAASLLPKKFNFIDVGCSRGFFSMYLLSLKNFKSRGVCIDPLKKAIADFSEILNLNKLKNVILINGVISNKISKKINLFKVNENQGYYSIVKDLSYADKKITKKISTSSFTIDQIMFKKKKLKSLEFLKIDTEGAELEVLQGSKQSIKKFKPIIFCEVTRKKKEVYTILNSLNYSIFKINGKKIQKIDKNNFHGDVLAIHKKSKQTKLNLD